MLKMSPTIMGHQTRGFRCTGKRSFRHTRFGSLDQKDGCKRETPWQLNHFVDKTLIPATALAAKLQLCTSITPTTPRPSSRCPPSWASTLAVLKTSDWGGGHIIGI